MSKATPIVAAFNAGAWTPLLDGRTDLQGYTASAKTLENLLPTVQGPAVRRGGTRYVREVKDSADRTWLVPFIRSRSVAYQVEFGDETVRFHFDRGLVLTGTTVAITDITAADPAVVTATSHGYSDGDDVFVTGVVGMTEVNGRWFKVASSTTHTFELQTLFGEDVDSTGYTAYASGGTLDAPYEIASPYAAADLVNANGEFMLDFVQSGDVLYLTHRGGEYQPRKLSRTSSTSWAFSVFDPDDGPFLDLNATSTTMYVSAATGSVTITASSSVFTADHVGALVRIDQETITATDPWKASTAYTANDFVRSDGKEYEAATSDTSGTTIPGHTLGTVSDGGVEWTYRSSGYGIARITAQGGTTATATVLTRFPQTLVGSGNASTLWRLGAWSDADGYPETVAFFRERLVFGTGQRIDLSVVADFESFGVDDFGEVLATSAIALTVQSGEVNDIVGMVGGESLAVHTEGAEFVLDSLTTSEAFGPGNVKISAATAYGSRPIRPVRVGEAVLFAQSSGRKLREMVYDIQVDTLIARDMAIRAEHLMRPRMTGFVRQEEPWQMLWARRSDGVLLTFTYDRTQEVRGWAVQPIGGSGNVESLSVIPSPDGTRDDVWMIVKRTINGATKRYVEFIVPEHETDDDQEDAVYVDSSRTYDGAAATVIRGLDHLEGVTVKVLADGASHPDKTVAAGVVTLDLDTSVAQIGYETIVRYASFRTDAGAADGTAQTKTKRITDVAWRVKDTLGGQAGPDFDNLDDIPALTYRIPATTMGSPPPLFTGDALVAWPSGYETDGRICYRNDTAFPCTLVAAVPQVVTQEAR